MRTVRRDRHIHSVDGGWFQARWHFSFDHYHDPQQMGVGALRVFNDDRIVAGAAWPMHPHRDIESLTYVVEGRFEHADSLDNDGRLEAGAAQVMTFSSGGALHSERNASDTDPLRFIQFWILPSEEGLENAVQQRQFSAADRTDRWLQIMGPVGEDGLDLSQDASVQVAHLTSGTTLEYTVGDDRSGYLYVIEGTVEVDHDRLDAGDAVKIERGPEALSVTASETSELILVDVTATFRPIGVWAG